MTVRAKAGLSAQEARRIESELVARGYRAVDGNAWEIRNHEYSMNSDPNKAEPGTGNAKYSICWKT